MTDPAPPVPSLDLTRDAFARSWALRREMLPIRVAALLVAGALLAPLAAAGTRAAVALSGAPALADFAIAEALLSPAGLALALLVAGVLIGVATLETAAMMAADLAARRGTPVRARAALAFALVRLPALALFSALLAGRCLLIVAPFAGAAAWAGLRILGDGDINHHLAARTPELQRAVAAGALILLPGALLLLHRLATWALALPGVAFAGFRPHDAFRRSAELTRGRRLRIVESLLLWGLAAAGAGALAAGLAAALAEAVLPLAGENLIAIAAVSCLMLALWALANLGVTAITHGALASLLTTFTQEAAGAARLRAPGPGGRALSATMAGALAVAAVIAAGAGAAALQTAAEEGHVLVIAHRGASAERPENTLAAFARAFDEGADWIELDVQETADGEVVVIHDSDFLKVGGDPTKVWDATMADIARIDIGSRTDPAYADQRAPTLRAALELAKGRGRVLIELKHYGHAVLLEERVAAAVDETGMDGAVAAMSLDAASARRMKALRPDWPVGLTAARAVGDLTAEGWDFLAVNAAMATPAFMARARAQRRAVMVWTLDDPVEISRAASLGVAGVITNRPEAARAALDARAEMGPLPRLLVYASDALGFTVEGPAPDASRP